METVQIKEKKSNTILYLNHEKCFGYQFINNTIKNVDYNHLNIFKLFIISDNYIKLEKNGKYDVYLDNNTGLKHYFNNNIENIMMLFLNNGEYLVSYTGEKNKNTLNNKKLFHLKNKAVICTFLGLLLAINTLPNNIIKPPIKFSNYVLTIQSEDYKTIDIKNMIDSSPYLTEEEKEYLYNESLLNDILEIVNNSSYLKNQWSKYFNNISIRKYGIENEQYNTMSGYYNIDNPNVLFVRDYDEFNDNKKEVIAHEFIHLCQDTTGYNLIIEACADIIASEYFLENYHSYYKNESRIVKKLMEIIGPESVWYYSFTGDFSMIEEKVKPHLSEENYKKFINDLTIDYYDKEKNKLKYKELEELLGTLYYSIYGKNIKDNQVISLIDKDDSTLVRYYFNKRYINEENSYYLDYNLGTYETISYEKAIDEGLIEVYVISKQEITKEEAFNLIEQNDCNIAREIDYSNSDTNISVYRRKNEQSKTTISCIIDGIRYDDANLDDLVKNNMISVNYSIIHKTMLTSQEYHNHIHNTNDEIYIVPSINTRLKDGTIEVLISKKIYLQPVSTTGNYNLNHTYSKNKKITQA